MSTPASSHSISRRSFLRLGAGATAAIVPAWRAQACRRCAAPSKHLRAAAAWLTSAQDSDGAWRSRTYGFFRDGDALTPLVLDALQVLPAAIRPEAALVRGGTWLRRLTDECCGREITWEHMRYPLFTAAAAARFFAAGGDKNRAASWCRVILALRHTPALGWPEDDPYGGGWSDAARPPQRPSAGAVPPDMLLPNVSATALAIESLHAAGALPSDSSRAASFVTRCRYTPGDGGFFFAPGDPVRNKAGASGTLADGQPRLRSYGSATADALRALLACGTQADNSIVAGGIAWLRPRLHGLTHPGDWPTDRVDSGRALAFYWASACAAVLGILARTAPDHRAWIAPAAARLSADLAGCQKPDGSWSNTDPESCEDDPCVASALAVAALTRLPGACV